MRVRRRQPCIIQIDDQKSFDLLALLSGNISLTSNARIRFLCAISGEEILFDKELIQPLAAVPGTTWIELSVLLAKPDVEMDHVKALIDKRLVVTDQPDFEDLVRAEERLAEIGWFPLASVYHAATSWRGVLGDEGTREHSELAIRERLEDCMDKYGPPPCHLPCIGADAVRVELPKAGVSREFSDLLSKRATRRAFKFQSPLALEQLACVLGATFGAQGSRNLAQGCVAMKRTSASGGGLHPIEPYVLILNVEGLRSGLYHYEWGTHNLALIRLYSHDEARDFVTRFTIGQSYFSEAHVVVFHVARVARTFWKYRQHPKAYKVFYMDAGHLSQTFYLAAADLGLGAFFTGAINDAEIAEWIGLDPLENVIVGANGLGIIDDTRSDLDLLPEPWPIRIGTTQP